jgi:hypothetical protein
VRFSIPLTERQAAWAAATVFTILGLLFVSWVPTIDRAEGDAATGQWVFRILGGVFLVLGAAALLWMLGDLVLGLTGSARREEWFWWGNFAFGTAGALIFAVPAALVLPAYLAAYFFQPNLLDRSGEDPGRNLWLAILFTVVGIVTLVALYFAARAKYRQRPNRVF